MKEKINFCRGQSLVEILVSITVGVIMIVGAIAIIAPALKINTDVNRAQVGAALAKELLDNVRAGTEANWHLIDTLATTSANLYYVMGTSPFTIATGTESIAIATTTYTRAFYVDNVCRNVGFKISGTGNCGGDVYDPTTKLITVRYVVPTNLTRTMSLYITRSSDRIFDQTDWSGGQNNDTIPYTSTNTRNFYTTSTNINFTTSTGSMVIQGF